MSSQFVIKAHDCKLVSLVDSLLEVSKASSLFMSSWCISFFIFLAFHWHFIQHCVYIPRANRDVIHSCKLEYRYRVFPLAFFCGFFCFPFSPCLMVSSFENSTKIKKNLIIIINKFQPWKQTNLFISLIPRLFCSPFFYENLGASIPLY